MRNKDKIKDFSNIKTGFNFTEIGGPRHLYRENLIINFVKEVLKKGKILDAGCGSGSLSLALAKLGFKVSAFDLSDDCVSMVRQKITEKGLDDFISVKKGDATKIAFPDETFDVVISGEVLEHISDDNAVIRECNRVLKNGGICVVTVPINPKLWDLSDEIAGHVRRYKSSELIKLFKDNGFVIEKIRFWGFPIMKLYHKLFFIFWVKKIINKTEQQRKAYFFTRIGKNKYLSFIFAIIFKIDNLFNRLPWGIGVIFRTRKVRDI